MQQEAATPDSCLRRLSKGEGSLCGNGRIQGRSTVSEEFKTLLHGIGVSGGDKGAGLS